MPMKDIEDHPRGCGENVSAMLSKSITLGSPPRMRGKRFALLVVYARKGITPADAGKTTLDIIGRMLYKDHPRGCGENPQIQPTCVILPGSPPRMRGKHNATHQSIADNRITPADAGKTQGRNVIPGINRDHPRGCGENADTSPSAGMTVGSPPRMRGKLGSAFF